MFTVLLTQGKEYSPNWTRGTALCNLAFERLTDVQLKQIGLIV